jgi:hypothetical protein
LRKAARRFLHIRRDPRRAHALSTLTGTKSAGIGNWPTHALEIFYGQPPLTIKHQFRIQQIMRRVESRQKGKERSHLIAPYKKAGLWLQQTTTTTITANTGVEAGGRGPRRTFT